MASPIISSFAIVEQQISMYVGIPLLIAGIFGGLLNLIVFLSLKTFRQNSCAFYLISMSIVNIGQLITGLLSRIMITGFSIDWTRTSIFYCKFRLFFFQTCSLLSGTCLCLATIDQYFATCSRPRWQQWSNIKLAIRLLIIFIIIWTLQGIPYLMFFNQIQSSPTSKITCTVTNSIFLYYRVYFIGLTQSAILPVIITFLFGFMAYRNVQQMSRQTLPLARRERDKQLTLMVLIQILFNFFTVLPYFFLNGIVYSRNLTDNPMIADKIRIIDTITLHLFYVDFVYPFYLYICVSERFRRQLIHVLFEIHLNRWRPQIIRNQVTPA